MKRAKSVTIAVKRPTQHSVSTHSVVDDRYEFTQEEVLKALRLAGLLPEPLDLGLVEHSHAVEYVDVFMKVPGGGDWSGTHLEVAQDCPLVVTVKRESNT